jgi:hypothetical protein
MTTPAAICSSLGKHLNNAEGYVFVGGKNKASSTVGGLIVTQKYEGTRGNNLKVAIVANPVSGFDITVYLGTMIVFDNLARNDHRRFEGQ